MNEEVRIIKSMIHLINQEGDLLTPEQVMQDAKKKNYGMKGRNFHIKRDGQFLCRKTGIFVQNQNYISWRQALDRSDLQEQCCLECQEVFYRRLSRTLTVVK